MRLGRGITLCHYDVIASCHVQNKKLILECGVRVQHWHEVLVSGGRPLEAKSNNLVGKSVYSDSREKPRVEAVFRTCCSCPLACDMFVVERKIQQ